MKIKSVNVTMDDGSVKEFDIIDCIILGLAKGEEEGKDVVLSQISENNSLQLAMLKNIIHYVPNTQQEGSEEAATEAADESPIEVVDAE
jgi:uncharacterized protein YsxB (DUF464 family)